MPRDHEIVHASNFFFVLGNVTRIRILNALKQKKKLSVTEVARELDMLHAAISIQLNLLYRVGLVNRERQGLNKIYSLNERKLRQETNDARKTVSWLFE